MDNFPEISKLSIFSRAEIPQFLGIKENHLGRETIF